ncbi:MAG TPA: D-alanyl-D-alanine carboxypeptidase family protein [Burkholderiales bacterium]|jgi:D-alanyl-D-alanine carboxypeptidase (penicillin-binding protein 5/6)|nr:D-alanyl-D-alanine carboxypeptidase family protein [Burkholderiales bacterium]
MRRCLLVCLLFSLPLAAAAQNPPPPQLVGRAWVLADVSSGQILVAEKPDERVEPASLTKLMTAYLTFAALKEKKLAPGDQVSVSEKAWRAPGSRMFIEPRRPVTAEELIRGMIVQSGNDACIALAERIAGSEEAFVAMMNREAERLGMKNTRFMNVTGLPDPQHYSSARDLYLLAAALIRDYPEQYAQYYSQREFRYNGITQPNRNRLLWLDSTVDGVKTGFTEAAGYCLIASSKRGPRRLLSVLLGSTSESMRAQESQKLLNWGFQFFDAVRLYAGGATVKEIEVFKGVKSALKAGFRSDLVVAVPKGQGEHLKAELLSLSPLVAPVAAGSRVGNLRVTLEGKPVGEYPVVALEAVPEAGLFGRAWDTLRLWLK